jgi:hypothetical protein
MAKAVKVKQEAAVVEAVVKTAAGETAASADLVEAVLDAWRAKLACDEADAAYKAAVEAVKAMVEAPCSIIVPGVCRAQYAVTTRVAVTHPETLETILGARYIDLVKVTEKVDATEQLIEMATDGDDPLAPAIRAALKISQGESFALRAEKPGSGK